VHTRFEWDVALLGPLFLDYGFAALDAAPQNGTEVFAGAVGISPGGIANLAIAGARLGLRTTMAAPFGTDIIGDWCWSVLHDQEGVDLTHSRRIAGLPTPITVATASGGDRSMITYAPGADDIVHDLTIAASARAVITDLKSLAHDRVHAWWRQAADDGTKIFADIGWDSSERWVASDLDALDHCHAFTPNEREAMAYTRTDDPVTAARALAERVPLVVVTRGGDGAVAIDAALGIEVVVPALTVDVVDPTGAGDVFSAALVQAGLDGLPLADQVAFATLASGIAVTRRGSALSAPGWADIALWWQGVQDHGDDAVRTRYGFLERVIPVGRHEDVALAPDSLQYTASMRGHR
jgi:sugar/nucleoside kinase (ribokinase family)